MISQIFTDLSCEPDTILSPSGENWAEFTQLEWALIENMNFWSCNWKTFKILSSEPVKSKEPFSFSETVFTAALCWDLMHDDFPWIEFYQTLIVASAEPEIIVCPSGVTAKLLIAPLWPKNRNDLISFLKFQTIIVLSKEALITCLKLGLKIVLRTPLLWPLKLLSRIGPSTYGVNFLGV